MNNGVRGLVALAMLLTAKKLKDKREKKHLNQATKPNQMLTKNRVGITLLTLDFTTNIKKYQGGNYVSLCITPKYWGRR